MINSHGSHQRVGREGWEGEGSLGAKRGWRPMGPWSSAAQALPGPLTSLQRGARFYLCLLKDSPCPPCFHFPDTRMEEKRPRSCPTPGKKGLSAHVVFPDTPMSPDTDPNLSPDRRWWHFQPEPTATASHPWTPAGSPSPAH